MSEIYIEKGNFVPGVIERLMGRYRVYGPVKNGRFHEFALLKNAAEADLGFQNTRLSPKGIFHPQAERMFEFSLAKDDPQAGILKEADKDFSPRVVLGIRPCDAKAFQLDDANFITETIKDPVVGSKARGDYHDWPCLQLALPDLFLHLDGKRSLRYRGPRCAAGGYW